jgi:predicted ATPase
MTKTQLPSFATFGEMLRYLRRRARLTQRELSIACGYSESQISRLEQNERLPDAATLLAVFVPALGLEAEPETVERFLELATATRTPVSEREEGASLPYRGDGLPRSNLPPRLTSLIGRESAIATLRQLVATQRLVALTGTGGVGKSTLSQAVGSELLALFADGVWLVELAPLADPALLPQSIAAVFRLPEQVERTPLEMLTTYLRQKQLLLILDNCEHLIDSCAHLVDHLRHTCSQLHILATSRESLRVAGEVEWLVPPLDVPKDEGTSDAMEIMQTYSAIRLFVERARAAKPDFDLSDQSAMQIAHICAQLDGIPLAIELAAARLKAMTVSEVAARLDDRFHLLSSGTRTAHARHQTLRAAIDWSYNLLSAPERALLRRLSVFSGGWSLDAVEAIVDAPLDQPVSVTNAVELLLQLVNKSLVVAEIRGAVTRYRLLETIRQYAAEKLREAGEVETIRARHFDFYLRLAEQWRDVTVVGRQYMQWLDRLEAEMDNLRAAYAWSRESDNSGTHALHLAGALWPFWFNRGRLREGQLWLEESLARATDAPTHLRATALVGLTDFVWFAGKATHAVTLAEEALRLFHQVDDRFGMAYSYMILAEARKVLSDSNLANVYYAQAVELFREVKWLPGIGRTLTFWAYAHVKMGRPEQAILLFEESLAIGRQIEEQYIVGYVLEGLIMLDPQRGKTLYRQELARWRAQVAAAPSDARHEMEALAGMLESYGRRVFYGGEPHDLEESIQALEECLSLWQKLGIQWSMAGGTARAYFDLGHPLLRMGEYSKSIACEQMAVRLYQEVGDLHGVAWAQSILGWPALALGDFALAKSSFCASLALAPDGAIDCSPRALAGMAELARLQGDIARAGRLYGAAYRYENLEEPFDDLPAVKVAPTYLDDPIFAAAWAEGEAMTLAQAIAYALS